MNDIPTPRTDEWGTISKEDGHWSSHQRRERWIKAVPSKVSAELETKLAAVTEQRDRLEEAFQDMLNDTLTPTNDEWIVTDNENYIEIASIKTCDSIASVHGGKTIGDQYDLAGRIARVPQLERELIAAREELKAVKETLKSPIEVELDMIRGKIAIPDRPELEYIGQIKTLTEQLDEMTLRWELTNDSLFDKRALADRLAEALNKMISICSCKMEDIDTVNEIRDFVDTITKPSNP